MSEIRGRKLRIAVYVCHCGGNISDVIDVQEVAKFADEQDEVVLAKHYSHMCSNQGQNMLIEDIRKHEIDKVVISACSPLFHGETFKSVLEKAGLNPYLVEMVNIREQCAWVHYDEPRRSTEKAKSLTAIGIEKVRRNSALEKLQQDIGKNVLVIGGGIAGIQASLDLGEAGFNVHLVEQKPTIGGRMAQLSRTFPTNDCAACILGPKMSDVGNNKNINLYTNSEIQDISGTLGDFHVQMTKNPTYVDPDSCVSCGVCADACPVKVDDEFQWGISKRKAIYIPVDFAVPNKFLIDENSCLRLKARRKNSDSQVCGLCAKACPQDSISFEQKPEQIELDIDTIIVATGYDVFNAKEKPEYGYGKFEKVLIAPQMERIIVQQGEGKKTRDIGKRIAFIQCVGSRDEQLGREYCSRVCCMYATKLAQLIRHSAQVAGQEKDIYVFYTDMRTFGKGYEEYYKQTQKMGVKFIRGRPGEISEDPFTKKLTVTVEDTLNRQIIQSEFDTVILSVGLQLSAGGEKIADILNLPKSTDGFLQEAHPKFKPVDTQTEGIFVAGTAQGPKDIPDSVAQASATASRAIRLMNQGKIFNEPMKAFIHTEKCDACGKCLNICPHKAIAFSSKSIVRINQNICKGCGSCIASCPKDAIDLQMFTNEQLSKEVKAALSNKKEGERRALIFADNMCTYKLADSVGTAKKSYPIETRIIRIPSSSRVSPKLILQAFILGADAIFIGDCEEKSTPFKDSIQATECNVRVAKDILKKVGIADNRINFFQFVTVMLPKFVNFMHQTVEIAKQKNPITLEQRRILEDNLQEYLFPN